uniref:Paired domain-containing protein n=1 Tax=Neolamprologus brichardi TaxID=32507 RepID=A0A3Q4MQF2_NEOBR
MDKKSSKPSGAHFRGKKEENQGGSYIAISKQFTVSRTAVRCIIAKYKETNSLRNKPGLGHKRKVSRTLERNIVTDVSKEPWTFAKMIVANLASSVVDVSRNTAVTALHRGGLQGHRPRRTPSQKKGTGLQPQEHSWEHHCFVGCSRIGKSFCSLCLL